MGLTDRENQLYFLLKEKISGSLRLPMKQKDAAVAIGAGEKELHDALVAMYKEQLIDHEIACRVEVQDLVDKEFCRSANLVSAPLLSAEDIRSGRLVPEKSAERPFFTVALPREFAGSSVRYCSFLVPDNVMAEVGICRGDVAVCAIGLPARRGSPVLCIIPDSGMVCIRRFNLTHASWCGLSDPERKNVVLFSGMPDERVVIGPVVSIQRFCHSWRPGMPD